MTDTEHIEVEITTIAQIKLWWNDADKMVREEQQLRWDIAKALSDRNHAGETQDALADELERDQSTVSRYIKIHRRYGLDHEGLTWNQCFQRVKLPKAKDDDPAPEPGPDDPEDDGSDDLDDENALGHNSDPDANPANDREPLSLDDLLDAIRHGADPEEYAEQATDADRLMRQELAEELYDWVCAYWTALEQRPISVAA